MPHSIVKSAIVSPLQDGKFDPAKPYNVCVSCVYRETKRCDGPNYLALEGPRRCEMLQMRLAYLKQTEPGVWTYKHIAELACTSEATVIRIFTDPNYDPRVSTYAALIKEVMGGSWGEYPCAMLSGESPELREVESPELLQQIAEKNVQIENLRRNYEDIKKSADAELLRVREEYKEDIRFYRERIDWLVAQTRIKDEQLAQKDAQMARKDDYIDRLAKQVGI